jgi:hypothetical protein
MKQILFLLLWLAFHYSYSQNSSDTLETEVRILQKHVNLGEIPDTLNPKIVYKLINTSNQDIRIENVKTSGSFAPEWKLSKVPPNDSTEIILHFPSRGKEGIIYKAATISGNFKPIIISFECIVLKTNSSQITAKVLKPHLNLGTITDTVVQEIVYELQNTGKYPLEISSVKGSCCPSFFSHKIVFPNDTLKITFLFNPKGKPGHNYKTAVISGNFNDERPILVDFECVIIPIKNK